MSPRLLAGGLAAGSASWTCRQCVQRRLPIARQTKVEFSTAHTNRPRRKRSPRLLVAAASGTAVAGAGALAFSDQVKHYYNAAERSGRVVNTLYANIRE